MSSPCYFPLCCSSLLAHFGENYNCLSRNWNLGLTLASGHGACHGVSLVLTLPLVDNTVVYQKVGHDFLGMAGKEYICISESFQRNAKRVDVHLALDGAPLSWEYSVSGFFRIIAEIRQISKLLPLRTLWLIPGMEVNSCAWMLGFDLTFWFSFLPQPRQDLSPGIPEFWQYLLLIFLSVNSGISSALNFPAPQS